MTGPEVRETIKACEEKQKPFRAAIRELADLVRKARDQCPHERRVPRHGDGVETSVCIYCEDEEHVRTYRCPSD